MTEKLFKPLSEKEMSLKIIETIIPIFFRKLN